MYNCVAGMFLFRLLYLHSCSGISRRGFSWHNPLLCWKCTFSIYAEREDRYFNKTEWFFLSRNRDGSECSRYDGTYGVYRVYGMYGLWNATWLKTLFIIEIKDIDLSGKFIQEKCHSWTSGCREYSAVTTLKSKAEYIPVHHCDNEVQVCGGW